MLVRTFPRVYFAFSLFVLVAHFNLHAQSYTDRSSIELQWKKFSSLQISPGSHHFGLQKQDKWISTVVHNSETSPLEFYIRFHNPHINEIEGYKSHANTSFVKTGDWYAFQHRPLAFRDFLIPIVVDPGKTDSLLFRINKRGESLSIEYELITKTELNNEMYVDYLWLGAVIGFVLLVAGFALFMGFNFKQPVYFIFSLYSILALGWLLNNMGVFYQYVWPTNILWHYKSRTFFSVTSICAYLLFLYQFFRSRFKTIDRILFISFAIFLGIKLYGVLTAPQVEYKLARKYVFILTAGIGLLFFLLYLIYFFIRNFWESKSHRLHLAAFLVYTCLILNETVTQFGISIFPFSGLSDYIPFLFFLLQLLLMTIGLSIQISQRVKTGHLQELFLVRENERAVSTQHFHILESERNRIGRDVHDQLGGLLVSIKLNLSNLKLKFTEEGLRRELDRIRVLVDSSINQLHQVVHDLVPPKIDAENFHEMVNERIRLFEEVSSIHFKVDISLPQQNHPFLFVHMYRIVCELISNSVQHAQCTSIQLNCNLENKILRLIYSDNGTGFIDDNKKEGKEIGRAHV